MAADEPHVHQIQNKFAQLLGEVILGVAPHVQQHVQQARADANHDFLEGMEQHVATLTGPMLKSVMEGSTIPSELRGLLEELGVPTEQFTGIISQFFVFGVMFTLAQAMLAPFVQQVQNDVWTAHPDRPLSPPDIATAVVRGIGYGDAEGVTIPAWAVAMAKMSGMDEQAFTTMVGVTGMAPSLQLLYEMVRRGVIPEGTLNGGGVSLIAGIQQSDIKDEWIDAVTKLRYVPLSPLDLVRAAVQDQWDDAPVGYDYSEQKLWAAKLGLEPGGYLDGNPDWFNIALNIAGRPPGPEEMGRAANRGIIPWLGRGVAATSFEQAISESDIKNKWAPILEKLAVYWPPSGEVGSLLKEGGIDVAQAEAYWRANGVPPELAKAYLYVAQIQQVTQDRALAKGDILTLVQENAIADADALEMLAEVGYSGTNAEWLLEMAHFRFELEALRTSVRTISTLYTGKKIDAVQAQEALQGLGMPAAQIANLLATLTHQRDAETVIPTASQIASALYYHVIDQPTAMAMLEALGYNAFNAWLVLSVRTHGPLPNAPDGYVPPVPQPVAPTAAAAAATASVTGASAP